MLMFVTSCTTWKDVTGNSWPRFVATAVSGVEGSASPFLLSRGTTEEHEGGGRVVL